MSGSGGRNKKGFAPSHFFIESSACAHVRENMARIRKSKKAHYITNFGQITCRYEKGVRPLLKCSITLLKKSKNSAPIKIQQHILNM